MKQLLTWLYLLRKTFLTAASRRHYSQYGEDVVLRDWFHDHPPGVFVDVGCYHPRKFSNTYWLYKRGWRGVNIDIDPLKIQAFRLARPHDINILAGVGDQETTATVYRFGKYGLGTTIDPDLAAATREPLREKQTVQIRTLESILAETPWKDAPIDLLSIDVEGMDLAVLRGFDLARHHPKLIMIELHADAIGDVLESGLHRYLSERDYVLCNWVGLTLFYRRSDVCLKKLPRR